MDDRAKALQSRLSDCSAHAAQAHPAPREAILLSHRNEVELEPPVEHGSILVSTHGRDLRESGQSGGAVVLVEKRQARPPDAVNSMDGVEEGERRRGVGHRCSRGSGESAGSLGTSAALPSTS